MIGQKLGPYELVERLGRGGMGAVYRALDTRTSQTVAIKVLAGTVGGGAQSVSRFEQEGLALSRIQHPHIVRALSGIQNDKESYFFVMELVGGGRSLQAVLSERRLLGPRKTMGIAEQVLEALDYAHRQGIIHRDIKPSNILLVPRREGLDFSATSAGESTLCPTQHEGEYVKVADFGLARVQELTRLTLSGQLMGTPEYMSPEQAEGGRADEQSDLYSMGIVMYEMLTGQVPFQAESPLAVLRKHSDEPPKPPSSFHPYIPPSLERLVLHALEKRPEKRFQTAAEMVKALRDIPRAAREGETDEILRHLTARETVRLENRAKPALDRGFPEISPQTPGGGKLLGTGLAAGLVAALVLFAASWYFLEREEPRPPENPAPAEVQPQSHVLLRLTDGTQRRGLLVRIDKSTVVFRDPQSGQEVQLPRESLREIVHGAE